MVIGRHLYEHLPERLREAYGDNPVSQHFYGLLFGSRGLDPDKKTGTGKRGPKGRSARELAELARDYIELCKSSRKPVEELAGLRGLSVPAVRGALHKARYKHGVLEPQTAGRAGGRLTDYGERVLREPKTEGHDDG